MKKLLMKKNDPMAVFLAAFVLLISACSPTVQVKAPDKPIEINLNVNIEHRVRVEIERDVQKAIDQNKDIF